MTAYGFRAFALAFTLALALAPGAAAERLATATVFDGCAAEGCGCGVPPELLEGVPYVALNVQNSAIDAPALERPIAAGSDRLGAFANGRECGRWIEIRAGANCVGHGNRADASPPIVCGVDPRGPDPWRNHARDGATGSVAYAVVADSCQDSNWWCRRDEWHLDLRRSLAGALCGLPANATDRAVGDCVNARRVAWRFVSAPPPALAAAADGPRFAWHCRANLPWYAPLVAHALPNGVSRVRVDGEDAKRNADLGQQWVAPASVVARVVGPSGAGAGSVRVEAFDVDGAPYPAADVALDARAIGRDCASGRWASPAASVAVRVRAADGTGAKGGNGGRGADGTDAGDARGARPDEGRVSKRPGANAGAKPAAEPAVAEPPVAEPPAAKAPAAKPPVTEPPAAKPPAAKPPAAKPPAAKPPVAAPPAGDGGGDGSRPSRAAVTDSKPRVAGRPSGAGRRGCGASAGARGRAGGRAPRSRGRAPRARRDRVREPETRQRREIARL